MLKFFDIPVIRQSKNNVIVLELHTYQPIWLIGVESCLFSSFSVAEVPAQHRENFVAQRAQELSPFTQTAYHLLLNGDQAQLWLWDDSLQRKLQKQYEHESARTEERLVLPEHLMLSACSDGLVARSGHQLEVLEYWAAGVLKTCRILPSQTNQSSLAADKTKTEFARNCTPSTPLFKTESFQYQRYPRHLPQWWEKAYLFQPKPAASLIIFLCCLALFFSGGNWLGWAVATENLQRTIDTQLEQFDSELAARDDYLLLQGQNQASAQWFNKPSQLELIAEFEHLVGGSYEKLESWEIQEAKLRATVFAPDTPSRLFIESLQKSPAFENLRAEPALKPGALLITGAVNTAVNHYLYPENRANADRGSTVDTRALVNE